MGVVVVNALTLEGLSLRLYLVSIYICYIEESNFIKRDYDRKKKKYTFSWLESPMASIWPQYTLIIKDRRKRKISHVLLQTYTFFRIDPSPFFRNHSNVNKEQDNFRTFLFVWDIVIFFLRKLVIIVNFKSPTTCHINALLWNCMCVTHVKLHQYIFHATCLCPDTWYDVKWKYSFNPGNESR